MTNDEARGRCLLRVGLVAIVLLFAGALGGYAVFDFAVPFLFGLLAAGSLNIIVAIIALDTVLDWRAGRSRKAPP
jgi:hypothetical protein